MYMYMYVYMYMYMLYRCSSPPGGSTPLCSAPPNLYQTRISPLVEHRQGFYHLKCELQLGVWRAARLQDQTRSPPIFFGQEIMSCIHF